MEKSEKTPPYKLEFGQVVLGVPRPIWVYESVPETMRTSELKDITSWRPVLYRVQAGPDAGKYYSAFVTPTTIDALRAMVRDGVPVYVMK